MLDQLFVYHPMSWSEQNWVSVSKLPLEDVWFQAADGTPLFGWYVQASAQAPVLLWCHGNAGNIAHRLGNLAHLFHQGLSVFLFDYRGYGRSHGKPSERGLYQDALAAYAYLTTVRKIASKRLVVFGRSLGSAVAGYVVSQQSAAGLILESSFPSIAYMARTHYFGLPAHWLLRARFDLVSRLRNVKVPLLVIHGDRDRIVPIQLGKAVYETVMTSKDFYIVSGAGHNDVPIVGGQQYFNRIKRFIALVTR
tara:strand:- start:3673 stop:4425 length:753 start_codon:yes stop_codon:yes gene_type:complete